MLSPREFTTLMLIRHAPDIADLNPGNLAVVLEHQLIYLEQLGPGHARAALISDGQLLLQSIVSSH